MKTEPIPAVFENGVLKPLEPLDLDDHQTVYITIEPKQPAHADTALQDWQAVYSGLSEEDLAEIESIALNRDTFMRQDHE